jgi:hypothetical protein
MRQTTIRDGHRHERLTGAGIDTAYREGNLRLSPHLFTPQATSITHSTFCTPDPQRKFAAPGKHPDHAQIRRGPTGRARKQPIPPSATSLGA